MGGLRWTVAGSLLIVGPDSFAASGSGRRSAWPSLTVLGVLLIGFGNGGVVWAEQTVPSGLTAVLVATTPFWMVGIERFMPHGEPLTPPTCRRTGRRLRRHRAAGLARASSGRLAGRFSSALLATQLACSRVGARFGLCAPAPQGRKRPRAAAAIQMLFGGSACCVAGACRAANGPTCAFNARTSAAFVYLLLVGSIVGFSAYAYALKHLPVATVVALRLRQPGDRRGRSGRSCSASRSAHELAWPAPSCSRAWRWSEALNERMSALPLDDSSAA